MTDETKGRIWYTAVFLLAAFYVVVLVSRWIGS